MHQVAAEGQTANPYLFIFVVLCVPYDNAASFREGSKTPGGGKARRRDEVTPTLDASEPHQHPRGRQVLTVFSGSLGRMGIWYATYTQAGWQLYFSEEWKETAWERELAWKMNRVWCSQTERRCPYWLHSARVDSVNKRHENDLLRRPTSKRLHLGSL